MEVAVRPVKDAVEITVPVDLLKAVGLPIDGILDAQIVDGELVLKKIDDLKTYYLDEMLAALPPGYQETEWDTGPLVGKEIWE